ncbi:uncharacterized protein LOC113378200 [Ctenocephalides felis]|uniref:uncharacterized protein LOC113378200 n=1 Tax=Ctenocephalides felis TaxID=7515 RepID=UPI000E6E49D2|nr:uncharacterized protein LOC113378200 [Ctenocephalides felis]
MGALTTSEVSLLHIQFDDDTSTYEYPSEASLLEDTEVSSPVSNSSPGLIGSVNLASYTPVKSGLHTSGSTFELGVTRTSPTVTDGGGGGPKGDSASINSPNSPTSTATVLSIEGAEEMGEGCLRPASDDQTVAWSQEQDATDLLF